MRPRRPKNLVASVRQRLLAHSRERGEDFNLTLTRYAAERFLFRLSKSPHGGQFVLKGAMLFAVWTGHPYRPTRDLDFLGFGDPSPERFRRMFQDICSTQVDPDGLVFDPHSVRVTDIRENQIYQGQRVKLVASLGNAEITLQVDTGFGDVITPDAEEIDYPALLGFPAPRIRAYPRETFIAEKIESVVSLGMPNSRMKDFYDLWVMAKTFSFRGEALLEAIRATFERRQTEIPAEMPSGLSEEFENDRDKLTQWKAFLARSGLESAELGQVMQDLRLFVGPPLLAAARNVTFQRSWNRKGRWS